MSSLNLVDEIRKCRSCSCLFKLVRRVVRQTIGLEREGIMLAVQEGPSRIAAYHPRGSELIVLSSGTFEYVRRMGSEGNCYLFAILLHEYLRCLGYNRRRARRIVKEIVKKIFGEDHTAMKIFNNVTNILAKPPELEEWGNTLGFIRLDDGLPYAY